MTVGDATEELPRTPGPGTASGAPKIPLRPEDVDKARAQAKADAKAGKNGASGAAGGTSGPSRASAALAERRVGATKTGSAKPAPSSGAARRVRLSVSRIDPWSALKMSFLVSVAIGIAVVVANAVLWMVLAGTGFFDQVNGLIGQVVGEGESFDIKDFIGLGRVVSLTIVLAVINVFVVTALSTLGAYIYNVSAALVGGLQVTLTDE